MCYYLSICYACHTSTNIDGTHQPGCLGPLAKKTEFRVDDITTTINLKLLFR